MREARLAQIRCAEQAGWITDEGVQLMGGHGYMRENPVERWYRDSRMLASLEGVCGL
jgi:alkylation response protein AidB-like acyl-CoA dehydrogenase